VPDTATVTADQRASPASDNDGWEWAIVEIFGHRRHVGRARAEEKLGAKMIRIDVPKLGHGPDEVTWSSHFYGVNGAIFSYTPTDERTVMKYAEREYTPAIPFRDHSHDDNYGPDGEEEPHVDDDDEF
jgi:hypothetical protein